MIAMITVQPVPEDILNPINYDEIQSSVANTDITSLYDPIEDISFNHDFVIKEANKFSIELDGCSHCNPSVNHFTDPRSLYDHITESQIIWVPNKEAVMKPPLPELKTPSYDPSNISVKQPHDRPRGFINVTRISKQSQDNTEFLRLAKGATSSLLKNIKNQTPSNKRARIQNQAGH